MNREEAKYLLRACRSDGQDTRDPLFQEALEMVKHDPELAQWFAHEQAVDSRLAEKLRAFPVPADLKTRLLAVRKVVIAPRWWQKPAWLAAVAACVVVLAALVTIVVRAPGQAEFTDFRSYAAAVAGDKGIRLDLMSRDVNEVRQWLNSRGAPDDFVLPAGLHGRPSLGCRVLDWRQRKVSFVCFELENRQIVHLFVIERGSVRGAPQDGIREMATLDDHVTTMAWSDAKRVYVLAGHQSEQDLGALL